MNGVVERQKGLEIKPLLPHKAVGVYIQVPFCQTKCTYCNFHTGVASPVAYAPYARAVEREILHWRALHSAAGLESARRFLKGDADERCHSEPAVGLPGRAAPRGKEVAPTSVSAGEESLRRLFVAPGETGSPSRAAFARDGVGKPGSPSRAARARSATSEKRPRDGVGSEGSAFAFNVAPGFSPASGYPAPAIANTIYIGGGTPSLFVPADLARILDAVRSQFRCGGVTGMTEITLEADPETITLDNATAWLAAGINRISLGAQSFHDAELKAAGRMHRREDIFAAIAQLRAAGFGNISLDLIAGLPHQTAASWQASVEEALRLRPEHISIYLFEIDEGSRLGKEILSGGSRYSASAVPSDDAMADSYEFACAHLARAGYEHYEISNWALPGFRSRHNLKYWRREPYFGFGAGAHSFDGRWRWANAHDPAAYAAAIDEGRLPIEQLEEVTPRQALDEELFLGLRQLEGIDLAQIAAQYAPQLDAGIRETLAARIEELRAQGLVEREGTRVRLAPARLAVSNEVFVALLD